MLSIGHNANNFLVYEKSSQLYPEREASTVLPPSVIFCTDHWGDEAVGSAMLNKYYFIQSGNEHRGPETDFTFPEEKIFQIY